MAYESDRTGVEVDDTLDQADTHIATVSGNPHGVTKADVGITAGDEEVFRQIEIPLTLSDENLDLVAGSNKVRFRVPHAMQIKEIRAYVNVAPLGAPIEIDILIDPEDSGGGSIFGSDGLMTIDAGERTSTTASAPYSLEVINIPDDSELTVDLVQVGSTQAGTGQLQEGLSLSDRPEA